MTERMSTLPPLSIGLAGPVSLDLLDYPDGLPTDLPKGYPAPIVAHFANALLRRGHSVVIFTSSTGLETPLVIEQGRLVVCIAPRYRPRAVLSFYARERRWLKSLMRQHPCDLVHAMWSYEFALAALGSGRPTLVHYRDNAWTILKHTPDTYRFVRWLLNLWVTIRAPHRLANSEYLKSSLGLAGLRTEVVPNFLPSTAAPPENLRPAVRNGSLLTVSNGFSGHKNVSVALRAFSALRQKGLAREYRLVGMRMGPGEEADLYARANGLSDGVVFVGPLPFQETMNEIASATLLVHPSLEESFGMTILEAMALGTPVVAGATVGNIPDLLASGECGTLCRYP